MVDETTTNPGSGESSPPMSFVERKAEALRQEREAQEAERQPEPEQEAVEDVEPEAVDAADSDEETELEEAEAQPEGEEEDDTEDDGYTARERELVEAAEQAEDRRKSMERDYRQKTQKLAEDRRAVEQNLNDVRQAAEYYAQIAESNLARFNGVNWTELQTKPVEYQAMQQQWQQANQERDQRVRELEGIKARAKEMEAQNRARVAEHSKSVLQHIRPEWNATLYQKAQEWAAQEVDFTPEEFDEVVDWRIMEVMVRAMEADTVKRESSKKLKQSGRKRTKAPKGRNQPQVSDRNAKGQYTNARKEAFSRPGNRTAFRDMKLAQIRLEGERGRK